MDEKKEFAIPPKKGMFEEPDKEMPMGGDTETEFIETFENEDGTKAVNISGIEVDGDGKFVAKLTKGEMESYAMGVLNGDGDPRGLQVGKVFEGDMAKDDAEMEADRIEEAFDPGDGATDDEYAAAITDARTGADMAEDYTDIEGEPVLDQIEEEVGKGEGKGFGKGKGKGFGKDKAPVGLDVLGLEEM